MIRSTTTDRLVPRRQPVPSAAGFVTAEEAEAMLDLAEEAVRRVAELGERERFAMRRRCARVLDGLDVPSPPPVAAPPSESLDPMDLAALLAAAREMGRMRLTGSTHAALDRLRGWLTTALATATETRRAP